MGKKKEFIIFVFFDPFDRQLGRLRAEGPELADRELVIVTLFGNDAGRLAGRTLPPRLVADLRERWELPAEIGSAALVGKDGGVKQRWSEPFEAAEVFQLVDAMPMRQREATETR